MVELSYGFMGKDWDQTLPPREIFEECLRVLKPGSFAFVMSAPRSDVQSRMVQMLEEVGFDVSFTPIYWAYATGFPKALNIGKAVDKRLNKKREVIGVKKRGDVEEAKKKGTTFTRAEANQNNKDIFGYGEEEITSGPASDKAKKLDGSYAGYQPKPAVEVVIVAMKPLGKKMGYVDQALDNGKGVTWLDDCRIPFAEDSSVEDKRLVEGGSWDTSKMGENIYSGGWAGKRVSSQKKKLSDKEQYDKDNVAGHQKFIEKEKDEMYGGGWDKPSRKSKSDYEKYVSDKNNKENYSDERGWDKWGVEEEDDTYERVSAFGDSNQSETKDGRNLWGKKATKKVKITKRKPREENTVFKTSGFKSEENDTAEASPLGRFAANLLVSDDVLNDGKVRKSTGGTGDINVETKFGQTSNRIQKPFNYQDEGSFSRYYDLDAWWESRLAKLPEGVRNTFPFLIIPKASKSEKNMGLEDRDGRYLDESREVGSAGGTNPRNRGAESKRKNFHPTVKPITLMSYLVTLGSRKDDVVLDPFMGSGTTPISCVTLDRKYLGIEKEKEYFEIAESRVENAINPANLVKHEFF